MSDIEVKGIDSIRNEYLHEFGLSSIKDATLSEGEKLFLKVIEDFKKGKLSPDELSVFGFDIFHGVAKKYPDSDLFKATLSASELVFSIRSKAVYDNIIGYLKDIDNFYSKNK